MLISLSELGSVTTGIEPCCYCEFVPTVVALMSFDLVVRTQSTRRYFIERLYELYDTMFTY